MFSGGRLGTALFTWPFQKAAHPPLLEGVIIIITLQNIPPLNTLRYLGNAVISQIRTRDTKWSSLYWPLCSKSWSPLTQGGFQPLDCPSVWDWCENKDHLSHSEVASPRSYCKEYQISQGFQICCADLDEQDLMELRIREWMRLEGTSGCILSNPSTQTGIPTAVCPGPCPGTFSRSPEEGYSTTSGADSDVIILCKQTMCNMG